MKLKEKIKNGVYIIAEMSANHAGSLENALELVKVAKDCGADCIKIQTYTADTITINCNNEYFKLKGGLWKGYNLYDLYNEAHTPWEWHKAIKDEAEKYGLDFLSTPFDKTSVDFLEELGVEFYKIASFELVDIPLIKYVASKRKPIIMSCGMGSIEEIETAINAIKSEGNDDIILLKCCSQYPANYDNMNVLTITDMIERFQLPVGLSDHSMGSVAPVVATTLGARVIEKHFCLSREIKNPDSEFSMEPKEFKEMVEAVNLSLRIKGKVSYYLSEEEKRAKNTRKSIFCVKDIKIGEEFTEDNIRVIRPGYGLEPKYYHEILGKKSKVNINYGEPIKLEYFK
ncbi:pseudaminic acid synthase [uncultured Clostridium sp.]|uniref:pseudaminic acid synthase n=1 Tax=uncultured Clostridium sp. TaxID=59620 RepID=UPI002673A5AB|nr:pseudaminic acid synthase [uncultured Clostridium sp.]